VLKRGGGRLIVAERQEKGVRLREGKEKGHSQKIKRESAFIEGIGIVISVRVSATLLEHRRGNHTCHFATASKVEAYPCHRMVKFRLEQNLLTEWTFSAAWVEENVKCKRSGKSCRKVRQYGWSRTYISKNFDLTIG